MAPAFAEVTLPGRSGSIRPAVALIVQEERAHEVASFVAAETALPTTMREASPVEVRWGYGQGAQQHFYGYVHHVEPLYSEKAAGQVKVVCIGASWPLLSGTQRTWQHQSLDTIVQEIVTEVRLSADAEPSGVIWPYIAASSTAWEFLLELADKIGYTLAVNRTEVRFLSPDEAIRRSLPLAPLLSPSLFRPAAGASMAGRRKTRHLAFGMDPRTGRLFSSTGRRSEGFVELDTEIVAGSPGEAAAQVLALDRRDRFIYQAEAEAPGNANVTQAAVVYITSPSRDHSGHWYVHRVEHDVRSNGEYTLYLQLGRDARGAFRPVPAVGRLTVRRSDPFGETTRTPPPSVLTNGLWRSGWARRAS